MIIRGENGQITLEFVERIPEGVPRATDVCCLVEVASAGFSGRDGAVWFSREAIERFLSELRRLEALRQGEALLTDYSFGSEYDGVRLCLFAVDGRGYIVVQAEIRKPHYDRNAIRKRSVWIEFEVDADRVTAVVHDFIDLLASHTR